MYIGLKVWKAYIDARKRPLSEASDLCAAALWDIWRRKKHTSALRSVDEKGLLTSQRWCHNFTSVSGRDTSISDLRQRESDAWSPIKIDSRAGLRLIVQALGGIHPRLASQCLDLVQNGRVEWCCTHPCGSYCALTSGGIAIRAPLPETIPSVALLAHEFAHALYESECPGSLAKVLETETVAMAVECLTLSVWAQSESMVQDAIAAWLQAREREFIGRHAMLAVFEAEIAELCWGSAEPIAVDRIDTVWIKHNAGFFGPAVKLAPSFAREWIEEQILFANPGAVGSYADAWERAQSLSNVAELRPVFNISRDRCDRS